MGLLRQVWTLARHDLRQEARDLELPLTAGFFTLVVSAILGLGFSGVPERAHLDVIPGLLWITVAFVGALTLTRLFDREREHDTLRVLLLAPVERTAIYLAKALVTLCVVSACALALVPILAVLFPLAEVLLDRPLETVALIVLGVAGYAAVGTLFAAGLATSSGKNVLVTVILYPLTTPVLLLALVATRALVERHPGLGVYLGRLAALDVVLLVIAAWLFEPVLVGAARTERGGQRS